MSISEGRPQLLEQQEQEKVPFRIKPKYFSRFSTPFFSKRRKDSPNQDLIVETEKDQNNTDSHRESGQHEKQEEENTFLLSEGSGAFDLNDKDNLSNFYGFNLSKSLNNLGNIYFSTMFGLSLIHI